MFEQASLPESLEVQPLFISTEAFPETILYDICGALAALHTEAASKDARLQAVSELHVLAAQQGVGMHEWRILVMLTGNAQLKING